jgi:hypothetical protein
MSVRGMALTEALIDNTGKLAALLQSGITAYLNQSYLPAELIADIKPNHSVDNHSVDDVAVVGSGPGYGPELGR